MSVGFPLVRVGEPLRYQALSVFPLFDGSMTPVEDALSDEGIGSGSVSVEEVSEAGSVSDAREAEAEQGQAETADVERLLGSANALPWQQADPVGEGEQYRANQGEEVHASALTLRWCM